MKRCPYCAEEIQDAAIVCRFCNRALTGGVVLQPEVVRAWNPGIAAVLSLVIPGAGQLYKGQILAGLVWLFCVVIGYLMLIVPGLILHIACIVAAASGPGPSAQLPRTLAPVSEAERVAKENRERLQVRGTYILVAATVAIIALLFVSSILK